MGTATTSAGVVQSYSTASTDPDGNLVRFTFDFGDGSQVSTSYVTSGASQSVSHSWPAGSYCVKALATDTQNTASSWSECLTVQVYNGGIGPTAPTNVVATTPTAGQVSIQWNAASPNGGPSIAAYKIYEGMNEDNMPLLGQTDGNTFSFVHSNIAVAGLHFYRVSAVSATEGPYTQQYAIPYHDYGVELKEWIPFVTVEDPVANYICSNEYNPCTKGWDLEAFHYDHCGPDDFQRDSVGGQYQGDNHPAFDAPDGSPGSFRVRSLINFRWNGYSVANVVVPNLAHAGETVLYRTYYHGTITVTCVMATATATKDWPTIAGGSQFALNVHSYNPVFEEYHVLPEPSIDANVTGTIDAAGTMGISYVVDNFPSHGIRVIQDGATQVTFLPTDASCVDSQSSTDIKAGLESSHSGSFSFGPATRNVYLGSVPSTKCP
jgi:hypothetical protein